MDQQVIKERDTSSIHHHQHHHHGHGHRHNPRHDDDGTTTCTSSPTSIATSTSTPTSYYPWFDITLDKKDGSLGFTIHTKEDGFLYIKEVIKEPAILDPLLTPGDRIILVNGVDVSGLTHESAISYLRSLPNRVCLRIQPMFPDDVVNDMIINMKMNAFDPYPHSLPPEAGPEPAKFQASQGRESGRDVDSEGYSSLPRTRRLTSGQLVKQLRPEALTLIREKQQQQQQSSASSSSLTANKVNSLSRIRLIRKDRQHQHQLFHADHDHDIVQDEGSGEDDDNDVKDRSHCFTHDNETRSSDTTSSNNYSPRYDPNSTTNTMTAAISSGGYNCDETSEPQVLLPEVNPAGCESITRDKQHTSQQQQLCKHDTGDQSRVKNNANKANNSMSHYVESMSSLPSSFPETSDDEGDDGHDHHHQHHYDHDRGSRRTTTTTSNRRQQMKLSKSQSSDVITISNNSYIQQQHQKSLLMSSTDQVVVDIVDPNHRKVVRVKQPRKQIGLDQDMDYFNGIPTSNNNNNWSKWRGINLMATAATTAAASSSTNQYEEEMKQENIIDVDDHVLVRDEDDSGLGQDASSPKTMTTLSIDEGAVPAVETTAGLPTPSRTRSFLEVTLDKGWTSRLGIQLMDDDEDDDEEGSKSHVLVKGIVDHTIASLDGRIHPGFKLMTVNGTSLAGKPANQVIELLRRIKGKIHMKFLTPA